MDKQNVLSKHLKIYYELVHWTLKVVGMIIYLLLNFPTIITIIQVSKWRLTKLYMEESVDHPLDSLKREKLLYLGQILFIKL